MRSKPILRSPQRSGMVCTFEIVYIVASEAIAKHLKRRAYSPELKSQVVAACHRAGTLGAGLVLAHGINANIVHRWLREHARWTLPVSQQGFLTLPLQMPALDAAKIWAQWAADVTHHSIVMVVPTR